MSTDTFEHHADQFTKQAMKKRINRKGINDGEAIYQQFVIAKVQKGKHTQLNAPLQKVYDENINNNKEYNMKINVNFPVISTGDRFEHLNTVKHNKFFLQNQNLFNQGKKSGYTGITVNCFEWYGTVTNGEFPPHYMLNRKKNHLTYHARFIVQIIFAFHYVLWFCNDPNGYVAGTSSGRNEAYLNTFMFNKFTKLQKRPIFIKTMGQSYTHLKVHIKKGGYWNPAVEIDGELIFLCDSSVGFTKMIMANACISSAKQLDELNSKVINKFNEYITPTAKNKKPPIKKFIDKNEKWLHENIRVVFKQIIESKCQEYSNLLYDKIIKIHNVPVKIHPLKVDKRKMVQARTKQTRMPSRLGTGQKDPRKDPYRNHNRTNVKVEPESESESESESEQHVLWPPFVKFDYEYVDSNDRSTNDEYSPEMIDNNTSWQCLVLHYSLRFKSWHDAIKYALGKERYKIIFKYIYKEKGDGYHLIQKKFIETIVEEMWTNIRNNHMQHKNGINSRPFNEIVKEKIDELEPILRGQFHRFKNEKKYRSVMTSSPGAGNKRGLRILLSGSSNKRQKLNM